MNFNLKFIDQKRKMYYGIIRNVLKDIKILLVLFIGHYSLLFIGSPQIHVQS